MGYDEAMNLYEKILRNKDTQEVPVVLVGNKCDLEAQRNVDKQKGTEWADGHKNRIFLESSAKESINNEKIFFECVRLIRKEDEAKESSNNKNNKSRRKF